MIRLALGAMLLSSASMAIRCDVDGRIETIGGPADGPVTNNLLECPHRHNICNRHVVFAKNGHVMCPIDGWVRP